MTTQRVRPAARAVAGLISLLILAGLTGGLPAALYAAGGSPIPHAVPSWHQVILTLGRPDNGTLALAAVRWVSWLAWALFAICAAAEALGRARGRPAARLPVIFPLQGLAASLVSTALLGLLPGPQLPSSAAPLPPSALAAATPPHIPGQPTTAPATGAVQGSARAGRFPGGRAAADRDLHREARGGNLPDLAARRPGSGEDWRKVVALNRGRLDSAGRRVPSGGPLPQHQRIPPARWKGGAVGACSADDITIPPDTTVPRARDEPGNPEYTYYTVRDGDNLWDIALTHLGNGEKWHQIYALNAGRPQPNGQRLILPGLIQPGWILRLHGAVGGSGHDTGRRPPAGPAPSRPPRPGRESAPSPQPSGLRSPGPAAAAHRREPDAGRAVIIPWGGLIGAGLAGAVTAALVLAGLQRRRSYQPAPVMTPSLNSSAPVPPLTGVLRQAARPAEIGDHDEGTSVPAGGVARGDGTPPRIATPAGVGETQPSPRAAAAQLPGVVNLGLRDGQEIAADIAALGGLGLTGPGATAAARALLLALLSQAQPGAGAYPAEVFMPATDAAMLIPGGELAGQPGLTVTGTLNVALDHLETTVLTRARITATTGDGPDPGAGTATLPAAGPVALIATPDPACSPRLAATLQMAQGTTVAILLGDWPGGVTCHVEADGTVTAAVPPHPVFRGLRLFYLTAPDAVVITTAFREAHSGAEPGPQAAAGVAGEPPDDGTDAAHTASGTAEPRRASAQSLHLELGDPGPVPSAPGHGRARTWAGAGEGAASAPGPDRPQAGYDRRQEPAGGRVQVGLLGPPRIVFAGTEITGGLRKARELLAFLALHPDGATGDQVSEALWPGAPPGHGTAQRNIALRKLRELLRTVTGLSEAMFVVLRADRYRLDPALFDIDVWRFQHALLAARHASGDDAQLAACREAVAAYHGALGEAAGYDWVEPYAEQARRRALDACTRIAEIIAPRDPEDALAALETALGHDPYNEFVYQKIMRLQAGAGRPDAVRRTLSLLEKRLTELGVTPSPQTRSLAASLLGGTTPSESSVGFRGSVSNSGRS